MSTTHYEVMTLKGGIYYVAQPLGAGLWRCGKCGRGLLTKGIRKGLPVFKKACGVCHGKVRVGVDTFEFPK